jgi:hypothetical protein
MPIGFDEKDKAVMDTVANDQIWQQAQKQYPYLADKNIDFAYTPGQGRGYLEFYPPGESGSPEYPRPSQLRMDRPGVQVFDPRTKPIDILADYVSHYGVNQDPFLAQRYQQFTQSLTPRQQEILRQQYQYYQNDPQFQERRPFEQWAKISGLPAYFRGYTFNQWDQPEKMYDSQQLKMLDEVRKYLGITPEKSAK